jgi:hypothetical protein
MRELPSKVETDMYNLSTVDVFACDTMPDWCPLADDEVVCQPADDQQQQPVLSLSSQEELFTSTAKKIAEIWFPNDTRYVVEAKQYEDQWRIYVIYKHHSGVLLSYDFCDIDTAYHSVWMAMHCCIESHNSGLGAGAKLIKDRVSSRLETILFSDLNLNLG